MKRLVIVVIVLAFIGDLIYKNIYEKKPNPNNAVIKPNNKFMKIATPVIFGTSLNRREPIYCATTIEAPLPMTSIIKIVT